MSSLSFRFRPPLWALLFATLVTACTESPRSLAADVSSTDVRRLPPGRNARTVDVMMQAADAGRTLGAGSAPLSLYIVSDYQCSTCRIWFEQTLPALRAAYVETGKVRVTWVHYPLRAHPDAVRAASASLCASVQGKFWEATARIFAAQEQWGGVPDATFLIDSLARVPGVDAFTFQNCTNSGRMLRQVRRDIDWADSSRTRTPVTVFIGARAVAGRAPWSALRVAIDSALAAAPR